MKKNDLYIISGTEYKEMTKEILAQSDLWAEIKKKADQKQKDADQMLIGIKPNLVSRRRLLMVQQHIRRLLRGLLNIYRKEVVNIS